MLLMTRNHSRIFTIKKKYALLLFCLFSFLLLFSLFLFFSFLFFSFSLSQQLYKYAVTFNECILFRISNNAVSTSTSLSILVSPSSCFPSQLFTTQAITRCAICSAPSLFLRFSSSQRNSTQPKSNNDGYDSFANVQFIHFQSNYISHSGANETNVGDQKVEYKFSIVHLLRDLGLYL